MLKEVLNDALHNLHAESGALTSSAIVSIDGLPIVSVLERNIDSNRVGSLSAALLSLCGQTARLLSCGNFNQETFAKKPFLRQPKPKHRFSAVFAPNTS